MDRPEFRVTRVEENDIIELDVEPPASFEKALSDGDVPEDLIAWIMELRNVLLWNFGTTDPHELAISIEESAKRRDFIDAFLLKRFGTCTPDALRVHAEIAARIG